MSAGLTLAGSALSAGVLVINIRTWWGGKRELKALIPFGCGVLSGAPWTLCAGGLLGWVAEKIVGAHNAVGGWVLDKVTGHSDGALNIGSMGTLTAAGACTVVASLMVFVVVWKGSGKTDRKRILGGLSVGTTLTVTAGFAQLMQWIPDLYNTVGSGAQDMLNGALPL